MVKQLRVIDPFLTMDLGDTFEWDDNSNMYTFARSEEFHKTDDTDSEIRSMYSSNFGISADYAKELVADGYLEEVDDNGGKLFVNVFDEIDRLNGKYKNELENIQEDMANMPECLKVERTTVLNNIISVLDHLRDLKK